MANIYGRQVVQLLTNKSGVAIIAGDVVIVDTTNNAAFTTTTSAGFTGGVGIAQESIASNATGRVLTAGYAALVNVNASVTRGNFGKTFTVAKQASDAGSSRGVGTFCQFLTGGTTPTALVYPVDLLGSSLTNPMTTTGDIIYSSDNSGTPARLAVGTSSQVLKGGTTPAWGTAIAQSTLGTTSIGASFTTTAATIYLKKVTMATAGLITGIIAGIKGDAANGSGLTAAIMSDNSGTPLNIIAVSQPVQKASDNSLVSNLGMNATARSITVPIVYWATAADYWLCVLPFAAGTSRILLAFSSGTGADRTQVANQFSDQSFIASSSGTNDYSIACNVLR